MRRARSHAVEEEVTGLCSLQVLSLEGIQRGESTRMGMLHPGSSHSPGPPVGKPGPGQRYSSGRTVSWVLHPLLKRAKRHQQGGGGQTHSRNHRVSVSASVSEQTGHTGKPASPRVLHRPAAMPALRNDSCFLREMPRRRPPRPMGLLEASLSELWFTA